MKKSAQIANFNVTFGEQEKPMLEYFDKIIFPAFTAKIIKSQKENQFLFMNIEIIENRDSIYILTGKIVKKTILEIKSDLDEEGNLIEKNDKYSSAPYSTFAINLMNHRMIFMQNQKGSPTLANFRSLVKYVLETYIKQQNSDDSNDAKLEYALVNVVGISSTKSLDLILNNVEKVNSLTLRFYPLNGDLDFSDAFGLLSGEARRKIGCKNGEIIFKNPKNVDGIKHILAQAAGTIVPIIKGVAKDKKKITLKDDEMSERYEIEVDEQATFEEESTQLVDKTSSYESLTYTNKEHSNIYQLNRGKIIPFVKGGE